MPGKRDLDAARQATVKVVQIRGGKPEHRGQGLLLDLGEEGVFVLTCHHVIAPCAEDELFVQIRAENGQLGDPIPAVYVPGRSHPDRDAVVLGVDREQVGSRANPLLHSVDQDAYNGRLTATGISYRSAPTFRGDVVAGDVISVKATSGTTWPAGVDRYTTWMFPLSQATDANPGISGGVVVCEDGVIGLAESARKETEMTARETYVLPLSTWAEGWPVLTEFIEPLIDRRLRSAAKVMRVRDVVIGTDIVIEEYREDVYLERDADSLARLARDTRGGVVIVGKPKSGKTRLAWELLRTRPDALVIMPVSAVPPMAFESAGLIDCEIILFLDDIHQQAEMGRPLEWRTRIEQETGQSCVVVATSRDGLDWDRVVQSQTPLVDRYGWDTLVYMSRMEDWGGEDLSASHAIELGASLGLDRSEVARRFDGTPGSLALDMRAMRQRYRGLRDAVTGTTVHSRLLDAAKILLTAYQPRLPERLIRTVVEEILEKTPVSGSVWEHVKRRTIAEGFGRFDLDGNFQTYRPYFEDAVNYIPLHENLQDLLSILKRQNDLAGCYFLGLSVLRTSAELAEEALTVAVAEIAESHNALGILFSSQPGRETDAESSFRQGVAEGDPAACFNLANWLARRSGSSGEVERLYRESIARGFTPAYVGLGNFLRGLPGRQLDAEQAYREGAEAGFAPSMFNLAMLFESFGRPELEIEEAYRAAIEDGYLPAFRNYGDLLFRSGRHREAIHAYRRALDSGDIGAANNLATSLASLKFPKLALRILQQAIEKGDVPAIRNSAAVSISIGENRQAVRKLRDALAAGDFAAFIDLAVLLTERRYVRAAEAAYAKALEAGLERAHFGLGTLLTDKEGREDDAETHLRKALNVGDVRATLNLGLLLGRRLTFQKLTGHGIDLQLAEEVEDLLRRAIDAGFEDALLHLGVVLRAIPGREPEGCRYLRRANDRGVARAAETFRDLC